MGLIKLAIVAPLRALIPEAERAAGIKKGRVHKGRTRS